MTFFKGQICATESKHLAMLITARNVVIVIFLISSKV